MNISIRKRYFVTGPHNILLVGSIVGCLYFFYGVISAFVVDYDMRILNVQTICEQPLNNRCVYQYSIDKGDGSLNNIEFTGYLFRDSELVVGNQIKKSKFSFVYQVNGNIVSWGYAWHYLTFFIFSIFALVLWRYSTPEMELDIS